MADYIRRIVSGNKARFKDAKLDMELDLVYVTERVIIMGYPASGIEGFYRNRREDAKKFLEHYHGKNYWIFNFCPLRENSYDANFFDGRVSRYPFPDHHAPPLAIIPLAVREINGWLRGSPDRVVVLHCKAGKGRSGTMACSYLLSISENPSPPRLDTSLGAKERAQARADKTVKAIAEDIEGQAPSEESAPRITSPTDSGSIELGSPTSMTPPANAGNGKPYVDSLKDVLDLHTSKRMKAPSSSSEKIKQGVSIPSQRRWLYYWALLLAHEAPAHLWAISPTLGEPQRPKVRLTQITLRMRETSGVKMSIMRAATTVMDRANVGGSTTRTRATTGHEPVWVSLARYDDELVDHLEMWEKRTRETGVNGGGTGHMGRRKPGSDHMNGNELNHIFDDNGTWDKGKMVRSFAKLGLIDGDSVIKREDGKDKQVIYKLRPLSNAGWKNIKEDVQQEDVHNGHHDLFASEANSLFEEVPEVTEVGIILDAGREVRVKLYMGQIFMGWLWFIPTFHLAERLVFTRKEIDFPLGIGSGIIDVEISLERLEETHPDDAQPPRRVDSKDSEVQGGTEPAGIATTMRAAATGGIGQAIEVAQATED